MNQKEYEIIEFNAAGPHKSKVTADVEDTIELYVNNAHIASILATPKQLEQLAEVRIDNNRIFTLINQNEHFELWFEIRSSGCIGVN